MPKLEMLAAPFLDLLIKVDEHDLDVNGDSRRHLPLGGRRNKVSGIVKIELLDRRKLRYTIGAEHKVQCFAHCALADVVRADPEALAIKMNLGSLDAPKVRDLQAYNFHFYVPVVRSD